MAVRSFPPFSSEAGDHGATAAAHSDGTDIVVALRGEWDINTRSTLCDAFFEVFTLGSGDVVVDPAEATFVDAVTVKVLATSTTLLSRCRRQLAVQSPSSAATLALSLYDLFKVETEATSSNLAVYDDGPGPDGGPASSP